MWLFHVQSRLLNLRHSLTTRFLLTCISSYFFDGDSTLDDLHEVIAADAKFLYEKGITAPLKNDFQSCFHFRVPEFSMIIMGMLDLQPDKKCSPVCFIACLHLRLVESTCGSYAWGPRRLGVFYAKMLAKSSIKLLFNPQVTRHFVHHDHQNHIPMADYLIGFHF